MTSKTSNRFNSKGRRKDKTRSVYNQAIDRTIVEVLSQIERMSNGQLKREVEERCKRTISPKTWSTHLKTMQIENYLLKDDTLQRNQKVFYSLTEYAKELRDLKHNTIFPALKVLLCSIMQATIICFSVPFIKANLLPAIQNILFMHPLCYFNSNSMDGQYSILP